MAHSDRARQEWIDSRVRDALMRILWRDFKLQVGWDDNAISDDGDWYYLPVLGAEVYRVADFSPSCAPIRDEKGRFSPKSAKKEPKDP
jgi:hypothetical protein